MDQTAQGNCWLVFAGGFWEGAGQTSIWDGLGTVSPISVQGV